MQQRSAFVTALIIFAVATATNAEARKMKVYNPTNYAVTAVQAKKPGAKEWDADLLGKTALGVGKVAEIEVTTTADNCKVDLRITFDDGHKIEKNNVDACTTDVLQVTD